MKKIIVLSICALFLSATTSTAQWGGYRAHSKGTSMVQVGYGFLNPFKILFKVSGYGGFSMSSKVTGFGPFGASYDYAVSDRFGIGLGLAYGNLKNDVTVSGFHSNGGDYIYTQELTQMSALVRGTFHFSKSPKFDPYLGVGLGYYYLKLAVNDNDEMQEPMTITIPGAFGYTGFLGARYFFSENVGAFAEVGYLAGSLFQLGVTFKFSGGNSGRW